MSTPEINGLGKSDCPHFAHVQLLLSSGVFPKKNVWWIKNNSK
jgi:hypothetical protein